MVAITLLVGLAPAVTLPAGRTFAALTEATQSLMSIPLPFLGALLAHDLWRSPRTARLTPTLLAATLLAAAVGVFGILVCALALTIAPAASGPDPWLNAGNLAAGSVLVQTVAQLTGTGLGLLLRSPVIACLSTIVLPMGLWLTLGSITPLHPAQPWLTPYTTAQNLLSGQMSPLAWSQWTVVVLIWGAGLNTLGAASLRWRKHSANQSFWAG
ncbi:hypothetical protein [Streptosporangium saharense]|uniref:Uncharacterized protein n=1 Tax=Streptosporangium saharense TaxID=1706840 RepID=A0A7W7QGW8_9ACTN|nr:hypothetical protein [Streptosporangium saharense]MBB4913353.1 hypothetical protein [Streptosporangium saharense]